MSNNAGMTIIDFLEARIAEDERRAVKLAETDRRPLLSIASTVNHPARVLAECAAKRAIMDVHHPHDHGGDHGDAVFCDECQWDHGDDSPRIDNQPVDGFGTHPCRTLAIIAAVYAGHPDYQQEWE